METNDEQLIHGMKPNTYVALLNLIYLVPSFGWIISIVLWAIGKDQSTYIDRKGKEWLNWFLSMIIYAVILTIFTLMFIFFIPLLTTVIVALLGGAFALLSIILPIIAGIKALNEEEWQYPFTLSLIK